MFGKAKVITLKDRFEYLKGLYEISYKVKIDYKDFMEAIFSKLEEELRSATSQIDKYHKNKTPTLNMTGEKFKYDYTK